jgi:adenine phosphoribosyltransferase
LHQLHCLHDDVIEIQKGVLNSGQKVLIVDDLLATGGTLNAAAQLIRSLEGVKVAGSAVVFEIEALKGRQKLTMSCTSIVNLKD